MNQHRNTHRWLAVMLLCQLWAPRLLVADTAIASDSEPEIGRNSQTPFAERDPRYRLDLMDEIEIEFRFTPEFNQKLTVQPDGFVVLQDVGDLKAIGMTLEEIQEAIIRKYTGILNDPVVTVRLLTFNRPYFIVGGQVGSPGKFDLLGNITMSDAIAIAGGFNNGARASEVLLFRRVSQAQVEVKRVNVKMALHGSPEEDVALRPGDSLFVPRSKIGKLERFIDVTGLSLYFPLPIGGR